MFRLQIIAALILIPSLLAAQEEESLEVSKFGRRYDAFLLLWGDENIPLRHVSELHAADQDEFDHWILIVLGDDVERAWSGFPLRQFIAQGGSLFVASDRSASISLPDLPLAAVNARSVDIVSLPVEARRAEDQFEGRPRCPIVREFVDGSALFEGVSSIALNHPGILGQPEAVARGLAFLPASVRIPFVRRGTPLAVMAGQQEGMGRWLVAADQTFLSNEMILAESNLRFADNLVRWLIAGRAPENLRVAVMVDGTPLEEWTDDRFLSGEWNRQPPITEVINELLSGLQQEDAFNTLLRDGQESLSARGPWPIRQALLILAASLVVARLVGRILAARRDEPQVDRDARENSRRHQRFSRSGDSESIGGGFAENWTVLSRHHSYDPVTEARRLDVERTGNLAAPLRDLAVEFMDRHFPAGDWREGGLPVTNRSSGWSGFWDRRRLKKLRRWALDEGTGFIGKRHFRRWLEFMKRWDRQEKAPEAAGSVGKGE